MRLIKAVAACLLACAPASAAPADSSGPVAADDDGPLLIVSAGRLVFDDELDDPYLVGLQYRGSPRTGWALRPGIGADAGADDLLYVYADVARDFALPRQWFGTLSFGGGWFANGERVGADYDLQFRSGIAVTRRLSSGARLGLAGYHVSNGGLDRPNDGAETLVLFLALPVRR
jgi:lipid A 3-O-deacylase